MPPKRKLDDGSSSGSDRENPMDTMVDVAHEIDRINGRRNRKRKALEADFNKRLGTLKSRVEKRLSEHAKKIEDVQKQQLRRLLDAVETRDSLQAEILNKLREIREEGLNLGTQLNAVYDDRRKFAEAVVLPNVGRAEPKKG